MSKQISSGIIARMNKSFANPSGRVYIHKYGLDIFSKSDERNLYLKDKKTIDDPRIWNALNYYQGVCSKIYGIDHKIFGDPMTNGETHLFKFIIGILWGNEDGDKIIDGFGFRGLSSSMQDSVNWPGNPEIYSWTFKNGVLTSIPKESFSKPKMVSCGDGIIVMGEEEKYRRKCKNFNEYINNPPKTKEFKLLYDVESG